MSRIRYAWSLIYWTVRHRSLSLGRWVAAYECHQSDSERALDEGVDYFQVEGRKARDAMRSE